ncbi:hypothetical protein ACHAW5_003011 [Stephanodiscus triporus]|uniref:Uncharacterized protein n=1 Tax=Stephanodiscus triporus TaxID=2934178 RepID=A0ABD3MZ22_9STRA
MPSLILVLGAPNENAHASGTIDAKRDTDGETGTHRDDSKNAKNVTSVSSATKDSFDATAKFGVCTMEPKKRKRTRSILAQLNDAVDDAGERCFVADLGDDYDDASIDNDAMDRERESSIKAASDANNPKGRNKKVSKKRTILDFYSSVTHKEDTGAQSDCESTTKVIEKKRPSKAAKFVALNEDARPIHVHIPFAGEDKNSAVSIEAHCVESKYDFSGEPLILKGEYPRESKTSIARFLSGFGRFCL